MNTRHVTLRLVAVSISTVLFGACALMRPTEPVAVRLPDALRGSWETSESNGDHGEVWILRDGGDLSVLEMDERGGEVRERESWNGSWWTQPSGNGDREICYVARHGRNAWCEEYELVSDPSAGGGTTMTFGDRTFRRRVAE